MRKNGALSVVIGVALLVSLVLLFFNTVSPEAFSGSVQEQCYGIGDGRAEDIKNVVIDSGYVIYSKGIIYPVIALFSLLVIEKLITIVSIFKMNKEVEMGFEENRQLMYSAQDTLEGLENGEEQ